jgi:hypothetical protein
LLSNNAASLGQDQPRVLLLLARWLRAVLDRGNLKPVRKKPISGREEGKGSVSQLAGEGLESLDEIVTLNL